MESLVTFKKESEEGEKSPGWVSLYRSHFM